MAAWLYDKFSLWFWFKGLILCTISANTTAILITVFVFHWYAYYEKAMAGSGSSMTYSFLLFTVILSLQEMYRGKLASTELYTILGGFISSLLFLVLLTVSFDPCLSHESQSKSYLSIFTSLNTLFSHVYFTFLLAVHRKFSGNSWYKSWLGCW